MKYQLRILKRAEADAHKIYEWIEERSPQGAQRWFIAFETAANKLLDNPFLWSLAPENELVDYEVRQFIFKTKRGQMYRAIYTVIEDEIRILHVRGSRQDLMNDLEAPDDDVI